MGTVPIAASNSMRNGSCPAAVQLPITASAGQLVPDGSPTKPSVGSWKFSPGSRNPLPQTGPAEGSLVAVGVEVAGAEVAGAEVAVGVAVGGCGCVLVGLLLGVLVTSTKVADGGGGVADGVGLLLGESVGVRVAVGGMVLVAVELGVKVRVEDGVALRVTVSVAVAVPTGVPIVRVAVAVAVANAVAVEVLVAMPVGVLVWVWVAVATAVAVVVGCTASLAVGVARCVAVCVAAGLVRVCVGVEVNAATVVVEVCGVRGRGVLVRSRLASPPHAATPARRAETAVL